jgi:fermentation-respiration switch protein FrsA (DUF1100 family)
MVDSPALSLSTPASSLPFGVTASYWLDLRSYDPVDTAIQVNKPMLILQGGRDYQVTVADDLTRWRDRLGDRPEVKIQVYPEYNHLFFGGSGPSTPAEYRGLHHVPHDVVTDIAAWIQAKSSPTGP